MNFKSVLALLIYLSPLLAAEPNLRFHDGTAWRLADTDTLTKLTRSEITAKARDGKMRLYSGIAISELLMSLSAPRGATLRGPTMSMALLITAKDGYQVVFSLAELDATFRQQNIILADLVDGKPLDVHEGPLMIVSAGDLRHSRWIRQVERIALVTVNAPPP